MIQSLNFKPCCLRCTNRFYRHESSIRYRFRFSCRSFREASAWCAWCGMIIIELLRAEASWRLRYDNLNWYRIEDMGHWTVLLPDITRRKIQHPISTLLVKAFHCISNSTSLWTLLTLAWDFPEIPTRYYVLSIPYRFRLLSICYFVD